MGVLVHMDVKVIRRHLVVLLFLHLCCTDGTDHLVISSTWSIHTAPVCSNPAQVRMGVAKLRRPFHIKVT